MAPGGAPATAPRGPGGHGARRKRQLRQRVRGRRNARSAARVCACRSVWWKQDDSRRRRGCQWRSCVRTGRNIGLSQASIRVYAHNAQSRACPRARRTAIVPMLCRWCWSRATRSSSPRTGCTRSRPSRGPLSPSPRAPSYSSELLLPAPPRVQNMTAWKPEFSSEYPRATQPR